MGKDERKSCWRIIILNKTIEDLKGRIKQLENEMARKNRLQAWTYQENVKEYERQVEQIKELETENKQLIKALRRIAAIDSSNDFTDSIIEIAQQAIIDNIKAKKT